MNMSDLMILFEDWFEVIVCDCGFWLLCNLDKNINSLIIRALN